ncbi:MAG: terminase small subunit [Rhodocyclaceae bacterium]|nr:terminase small subunit [Rhodocyclaceae bacterium]
MSARLTPRQQRFVEEFTISGNAADAARRAGYSEKTARQIACENLTKPDIQAAITAKRQGYAAQIDVRRDDVIAGLFTGIAEAQRKADAGNLIRGWVEVAKLTGLDKPDAKSKVMRPEHAARRAAFEALSDAELLAIAEGQI